MKAVPALTDEPPGLAAWKEDNPEDDQAAGRDSKGAWNRFKDSGHAYAELLRTLVDRQQGLCGYCEQRVTRSDGTLVVSDYQVEHVAPKSGAAGRVLDWQNMMLCCGGGAWPYRKDEPTRYLPGGGSRANLCCGQAKGDAEVDAAHDPRAFDWREPIVEVGLDGRMRANEGACRRARIDPTRLDETITMLGLNCERLKLARRAVADNIRLWVVQILEETIRLSPHLPAAKAARIQEELVGGRLGPDERGHLQPFWTTERQYLGPPAEAWIRQNARALHFE